MIDFLRKNFGYSKNESLGVATLCLTLGFIALLAAYNNHASKKLETEPINEAEIQKLEIAQSKLEEKDKLAKSLYKKNYLKNISSNNKTSNREIKSSEKTYTEKQQKNKVEQAPIDLNTATASDLQKIRWVGEYSSSKIVKYRDNIGGFVTKKQLQVIGRLSENTIKSLFEFTYIDKDFKPAKRNINTASFKEFLKLPYMNYDLVKKIFNHKQKIQNFKSLEDLKEITGLTTEEWMVLANYITI